MYRNSLWNITLIIFLLLSSTMVWAADTKVTVREIFEKAAQEVVSHSSIAVYVPVSIQSLDKYANNACAFSSQRQGGYEIAIHARITEYGKSKPLPCEGSDASLLAVIHGDNKPMPDMSKERRAQRVTLKSGATGWFFPVSCGGSCAPATLYWQTHQASYRLQLKLGSRVPVAQQRKEMIDTVNSIELVSTRR